MKKIELNEQFKKALALMERTSTGVFITGKAGTGKSTLLEYFRSVTRKNIVVLAPTGVAALNVGGETIHSFCGFKPDITVDKVRKVSGKKAAIFKELDAIVIDEISMVRADLLDCVDAFLRLNGPAKKEVFGGVQMIFIGDLYQLPPVVTSREKEFFKDHYATPYFFSSRAMDAFPMELIELEKIYRQKDAGFIELLNAIRNNTVDDMHLSVLNQRVGAVLPKNRKEYAIYLTTKNKMAADINAERLGQLKAAPKKYDADVFGDFGEKMYPTEYSLNIAKGAQVMLLNNDTRGRWVNGTLGKVARIRAGDEKDSDDVIEVKLADGRAVEVMPFTWQIFHFTWNDETRRIETEDVGSFTQYPLKLAWAITIHKSQGKTFKQVIIDMGSGAFAYGQTYVALSRCVSFDGLSLVKPIKRSHIFSDWRIVNFMTKYQYALSERDLPFEEKIAMIEEAIRDERSLEMTYLKTSDEKTRRVVSPYDIGEKYYRDKPFFGMEAYCHKRQEERVFRVDRILDMKLVDG